MLTSCHCSSNIRTVVINDLKLKAQTEYLRIDAIGYESKALFDWTLRIAFEHENRDTWPDELCKLAHVAADLLVIVSYTRHDESMIKEKLQEEVDKRKDRMDRVRDSKWLFVFGPF